MAEYIAREVLLAQLRAMESYNVSPMYRRGYDDCVEAILKAPAADVVPVVRCKDCKHLRVRNQKDIYAFCPKTGIVFWQFEKDTRTSFCSDGERMDGGAGNV